MSEYLQQDGRRGPDAGNSPAVMVIRLTGEPLNPNHWVRLI